MDLEPDLGQQDGDTPRSGAEVYDPSGTTEGYATAPTASPTELAQRAFQNQTVITINGAEIKDPKELARLIKEQIDKDKARTSQQMAAALGS